MPIVNQDRKKEVSGNPHFGDKTYQQIGSLNGWGLGHTLSPSNGESVSGSQSVRAGYSYPARLRGTVGKHRRYNSSKCVLGHMWRQSKGVLNQYKMGAFLSSFHLHHFLSGPRTFPNLMLYPGPTPAWWLGTCSLGNPSPFIILCINNWVKSRHTNLVPRSYFYPLFFFFSVSETFSFETKALSVIFLLLKKKKKWLRTSWKPKRVIRD